MHGGDYSARQNECSGNYVDTYKPTNQWFQQAALIHVNEGTLNKSQLTTSQPAATDWTLIHYCAAVLESSVDNQVCKPQNLKQAILSTNVYRKSTV